MYSSIESPNFHISINSYFHIFTISIISYFHIFMLTILFIFPYFSVNYKETKSCIFFAPKNNHKITLHLSPTICIRCGGKMNCWFRGHLRSNFWLGKSFWFLPFLNQDWFRFNFRLDFGWFCRFQILRRISLWSTSIQFREKFFERLNFFFEKFEDLIHVDVRCLSVAVSIR